MKDRLYLNPVKIRDILEGKTEGIDQALVDRILELNARTPLE